MPLVRLRLGVGVGIGPRVGCLCGPHDACTINHTPGLELCSNARQSISKFLFMEKGKCNAKCKMQVILLRCSDAAFLDVRVTRCEWYRHPPDLASSQRQRHFNSPVMTRAGLSGIQTDSGWFEDSGSAAAVQGVRAWRLHPPCPARLQALVPRPCPAVLCFSR